MDISVLIDYLSALSASIGVKLLEAILILIIGLKLIKKLKKFIQTSPKLDKIDNSLRSFLVSFIGIVTYVVLFMTIAMILGIPITSFITLLASCGVAVGLAMQGSLSNFAGGIMLLLFKPFKVGDYIEAAGESGTVVEISVVYTVILTLDNKRITIPNGTLTNTVIENYSAEEFRRVDLVFNAAYDCDMAKVKGVIEKVINAQPEALKDPAPFVRVSNHLDSALEYTVRIWCKNADYWTVYFDVTENVKKAFDENNIQIPFKQIDVHLDK